MLKTQEYQEITDGGRVITVKISISVPSPSVTASDGASSSGMRNESQTIQPNDDTVKVELEGEEYEERLGEVEQPQATET